ncbi:MAG: ATP-binding protein [Chthonomonadales bacterium]
MSDTDRSTSYLRTLLELGQVLNSSLDLSQVLRTAIDEVVRFVHAERGFILIVEPGSGRVVGKATHDIDPVALELGLTGKDPSNAAQISRTIVEHALRTQEPVLSLDALQDPRFASHTSVRLAQVRSVLCVPLIAQGRPIGVIYLDNRAKTGIFNEQHVEMLTAFANQAATAVENARLYENLRKSMEERIQLQQKLHKEETQRLALEEAARLKNEFISYVSHELRNPLTTIRGFIQTLQADGKLDAQTRNEFYDIIEAETTRMLGLINDLLDSSRLEAGKPITLAVRPVSLANLIRKAARAIRFYKFWTEAHSITVSVPDDLPEIEADADKLSQILDNLLTNAVKYSPNGGEISIQADALNGSVRIVVEDHGVGMTQEQLAKLFQRFERVERQEIAQIPGTGLGLYLTRHLVELHGGSITCESEAGKGSRFIVTLPVKPPAPVQTEQPQASE